MQKFCTHCGKNLAEVLKFCTYCGAPLGARPLNPKLVLETPPALAAMPQEAREITAEDTTLEFLPLDFKPLEAAVLRKDPSAEEERSSEEKAEGSAPSPIVKAAAIVSSAAEPMQTPADEESPSKENAETRNADFAASAGEGEARNVGERSETSALAAEALPDEAASPKEEGATPESVEKEQATREEKAEKANEATPLPSAEASQDETLTEKESEKKPEAAETASPAAAAQPEAAETAPPSSDEQPETRETVPPSAGERPVEAKEEKPDATATEESSGGVVRWLFRLLLLLVLLVGGLMVYRGVGFDKLTADPVGTVRLLFGQAPAKPGTKDDAFWYPDTKQGALVRGAYDVSSGRTVCWYGGTVQKDGRTYANGDGVANWYKSDGSFEQSDEGVFVAGRRDGKIKHTYADGRVETLQWKNGEQVK